MSKEQYEWVIAMARLWAVAHESADQDAGLQMERVDGIAGRLAPNDWEPSNDDEFAASLAALAWLLLVADLQKRAAARFPRKTLVLLVQNQTQIYPQSARFALFFAFSEIEPRTAIFLGFSYEDSVPPSSSRLIPQCQTIHPLTLAGDLPV